MCVLDDYSEDTDKVFMCVSVYFRNCCVTIETVRRKHQCLNAYLVSDIFLSFLSLNRNI